MEVAACRSKFILLFLFLALFGLVFLLNNFQTVESWNCHTMSALQQLQSRIQTSIRPLSLPTFHHNRTFCSHVGQKASPEDELEERKLLESIAWPLPPTPAMAAHQSSDPQHSRFTIVPPGGRGEWHVGGRLKVQVQMYDFNARPKAYGGDFLLARLHSPQLGAGVAGEVSDHRNGSYTVAFPLLWAGSARVEVTLVHSSEAVAVLHRLREERSDRVYFQSLFQSGHLTETTMCNLCLSAEQQPLCNFTDLHTGEPWFCYRPKRLSCDTRINHAKGGYVKELISSSEALLFQSDVNIKVKLTASGADNVTVLPPRKGAEGSSGSSVSSGYSGYSGYYYKDVWRPLGAAPPMRRFSRSSDIRQCLSNKMVYLYGDSTARQWFEYLVTFVPELKEFDLRSPKNVGPYMAVDSTHNILVKYRCHGPPIRFSTVMASELRYVFNELDGLVGGPNTVVVISVWSHFSTFPVEVYIRRLRHIRRAVLRLQNRAPGTMVVVRSGNLQALNEEVSLYNSDWFSLQLHQVLTAMFRGLDVLLVDAWQMTAAHHLPHNLHPQQPIVRNMMDLFLSRICPEKKGS